METKRHSRTSRLIVAAVLVLLTFLFSGCASSHHSSYSPQGAPISDKLIVPGKRIGPIALGMPQADVMKILGKPPRLMHYEDGGFGYFYDDLTVIISEDSRVLSVSAISSQYATADGICVGMTEPEVRAKKGKPTRSFRVNEFNLTYYYEGRTLKILFDPTKGHRIFTIRVE